MVSVTLEKLNGVETRWAHRKIIKIDMSQLLVFPTIRILSRISHSFFSDPGVFFTVVSIPQRDKSLWVEVESFIPGRDIIGWCN